MAGNVAGGPGMSAGPNQADVDGFRGTAAAVHIASEPVSTTVTIWPGETPARDMPFGMVVYVCEVLAAYGLHVTDQSLKGFGIVEVEQALLKVIDFVPVELGGRKPSSSSSPSR